VAPITDSRWRARLTLLLTACAPFVAACPLPIARTETASAPVLGSIVWADGTPASGLEIAVSTEWSDAPCTKPALRVHTDVAGTFRLPGTQKHYKTTWFVPNLDLAAPRFHLCATVRDTSRKAYMGYGSLGEIAKPDSVMCVIWEWGAIPRVSCTGRAKRAVVTGGRWAEEAGERGEGFYRLFLTEEPTRVKGYKTPRDRPHVYVQWVEPPPTAPAGQAVRPYRVRETVSLPLDRDKVWAIAHADLWRREGRWMVSLEGHKHAFMNDMARAEVVFELGPPGQVRMVAGP
jgi:hypothetical protein